MDIMPNIQGADRPTLIQRGWRSLRAVLVLTLGCLPLLAHASHAHGHTAKPAAQHGRHKPTLRPKSPKLALSKHSKHRTALHSVRRGHPAKKKVPDKNPLDHRRAAVTSIQHGKASYYGDSALNGHRTASGERFSQDELTAAHRSLPFGTRIRVINLANQRQVVVRVNDRGPFVKGRIIDLTTAAAQRMGMTKQGVAHVRLEVLGHEEVASSRERHSPIS